MSTGGGNLHLKVFSLLLLGAGAGVMLWGAALVVHSLQAAGQNGSGSMNSLMDVAIIVVGWVVAFGGYTLDQKIRTPCQACGVLNQRTAPVCERCGEPLAP